MHTISTVFVAEGFGIPQAADDAAALDIFGLDNLPSPLCFDHDAILTDYTQTLSSGK
jgi:hypothetical protein